MRTAGASESSKRIFGLDMYRAMAILLVVFVHGGSLLNDTVLDGFPYIRLLDGVDFFFVLSGYLIGKILLHETTTTAHYKFKDLFRFWKRRWFRTLPNYYLILLLNVFMVCFGIIHEDIHQFNWKFFVFLQNFSSQFSGFFWESWSLSVEEWFYLISPFLLLILLQFLPPKTSFLTVTVLMITVPLLYRISQFNPSLDSWHWDLGYRKVVLTRLDSIGYGMLAAWIYFYHGAFWKKSRYYLFIAGSGLIYFIVHYSIAPNTFHAQTIHFSIVPLSAMLLLPLAEYIKKERGYFGKAVVHISKISYSMYLINLCVVYEIFRDHFPPQNDRDAVLKYVLYWVILITASTLLYKYFEKPMMNLRDKPLSFQSVKAVFTKG